jgi:hypothetical protein
MKMKKNEKSKFPENREELRTNNLHPRNEVKYLFENLIVPPIWGNLTAMDFSSREGYEKVFTKVTDFIRIYMTLLNSTQPS